MRIVPINLGEACEFVRRFHRHHPAPQGGLFAIAVAEEEEIVGVAIVGRPVARNNQDGLTAEITRTCTDGTKNVNSMLYGACWRAARALGYRKLITYTLTTESGISLRAAGMKLIGESKGGSWNCPSRPRIDKHPTQAKLRWEKSIPPIDKQARDR